MRLEHGLMLIIAILIGSIIGLEGERFPVFDKFIFTFFTALFLEASTFALNDYFDLEIDVKNKRFDRPLVCGAVSPKTALILFFMLFPLGILSSFFVNYTCFTIAVVTGFLAIVYDVYLKRVKLVGNFYIAYTMAIPFVFGGAAVVSDASFSFAVHPAIYIVACIAFLAGSGREIMKDVMDFEGDTIKGVLSFPKYIGVRWSNSVSAVFYLVAIVLSFIPFFQGFYEMYFLNYYYLFLVLICDSLLLSTAFNLLVRKNVHMKLYRRLTLVALFIGLLAFLIGAIMH